MYGGLSGICIVSLRVFLPASPAAPLFTPSIRLLHTLSIGPVSIFASRDVQHALTVHQGWLAGWAGRFGNSSS